MCIELNLWSWNASGHNAGVPFFSLLKDACEKTNVPFSRIKATYIVLSCQANLSQQVDVWQFDCLKIKAGWLSHSLTLSSRVSCLTRSPDWFKRFVNCDVWPGLYAMNTHHRWQQHGENMLATSNYWICFHFFHAKRSTNLLMPSQSSTSKHNHPWMTLIAQTHKISF